MAVLLLGPRSDPQLEAVEHELETRGVETVVWNADNWPGDGKLSFHQTNEDVRVAASDTVVDGSSVHTAYLRNFALNPRLSEYESQLENRPFSLLNQLREYQAVLESMLYDLQRRGVRMINPLESQDVHKRKPWQLSRLADAGVPVPETLTTTDPDAARAFVDRLEDVVYKPVSGGGHAAPVTAADLTADRLSLLTNAPVQFQERIDGDDLRIFVVNGEIVAAARIVADELDYRTTDHDVERIDHSTLDSDIADAAVQATDCLGLAFSGVDVVDGGDRFRVLEANPSPMFATFDEQAGTDVAGALADLLADRDVTPN
ncbi:ATP-grasp domain-containing protein [Natronolimnohabitans sp. A-GB9]|uniref:ATP-grasp domain-containing protein n=1 Tax=Natronolimnohabitans sp. A-GB9 TaxID=3069757 RepID=UPI0027B2AB0C|nr:ATP-grasp domain-containing protein [Natronolimnohabitans sp. A-GB9]MDQ2050456.1 ATP-grasp domain-containing protein [Natronolimnohabitans sp. A-GB9]